jgi:5-methylcytosine-specific restriction endonuclease McrA
MNQEQKEFNRAFKACKIYTSVELKKPHYAKDKGTCDGCKNNYYASGKCQNCKRVCTTDYFEPKWITHKKVAV